MHKWTVLTHKATIFFLSPCIFEQLHFYQEAFFRDRPCAELSEQAVEFGAEIRLIRATNDYLAALITPGQDHQSLLQGDN